MNCFTRHINCSVCPVKDGKTSIATIISDDGEIETSYILARLAMKYNVRISIASPVDNILKNLRHWQLLESNFPIEIVNHSWNHVRIDDDSKVNLAEIRHQYLDSKDFFNSNLKSPDFSFVPPHNQLTPNGFKVLEEGGFLAVRSWHRGLNAIDVSTGTEPGCWFNLKCRGIGDNDFDIREELTRMLNPAWLIEMWHNVYTTNKAGYQPIYVDEAERHIQTIRENENIWFAGFDEAISYLYQRDNVSIFAFLHNGILHLKLGRKNGALPWEKFNSPLSVRISNEGLPLPFSSCEPLSGLDVCRIDERTGDIIAHIMPGRHGQIRIFR